MTIEGRFVADTCAIICYFSEVFPGQRALSLRARRVLDEAFAPYETNVRLSIPGVVFIELFDKWCRTEEDARRVYYEVVTPAFQSPNIEIRPIEREIVTAIVGIGGSLMDHEVHDKIVLASAIVLECPLITTDTAIEGFNRINRVVPEVLC